MNELERLIEALYEDPTTEPIASEIGVLQSIYGEDAVQLWKPSDSSSGSSNSTIRYTVSLNLPDPHQEIPLSILVSIPPTYPSSSPPQLQLLSRYIGPYGVSSSIFGAIIRTFISANQGVEWTSDSVCVFDGLEHAKEQCGMWYEERLTENAVGEIVREEERENHHRKDHPGSSEIKGSESIPVHDAPAPAIQVALPSGVQIIEADPIIDRKSTFVGRACQITDPSHVPLILAHLLSDKRISRATHPIINAWRCHVGNVLHHDNDDDGETAAGGRLAHLLQILEVDNVLVVVTRQYGGTLLGPDRFKHITQAARSALELGGFLDSPSLEANGKKTRTQAKKK